MIYLVIRFADRDGIVFEGTETEFRQGFASTPWVVNKEAVGKPGQTKDNPVAAFNTREECVNPGRVVIDNSDVTGSIAIYNPQLGLRDPFAGGTFKCLPDTVKP